MTIATDVVWKQFSDRLRRFIRKRVREPHDADDILQDVFIKIHRRIDQLKDDGKLGAWVFQIARNAVIDYYRSREKEEELPEVRLRRAARPVRTSDSGREIALCLKPMIARLPPSYREAVVLAELEGVTQVALAKRLKVSLSGAKSRVQRGREKIKAMLLDCCHFEFDRRGKMIDYRPKGTGCSACLKHTSPK